MSEEIEWLIWSTEHRQWWGPNWRGYTAIIEQAGRYPKRVADQICREANFGGQTNEIAFIAPGSMASVIAKIDEVEA